MYVPKHFVGIQDLWGSKLWVPKTVDIQMIRYSKEIIGLQNCGIKSANIETVVTQKFGGSQNLVAVKVGSQNLWVFNSSAFIIYMLKQLNFKKWVKFCSFNSINSAQGRIQDF